jgi:hypothetical protein
MTSKPTRLKYFLTLCLSIAAMLPCQVVSGQSLIRKTQQFSSVYYQYPVQFFRNGFKSGIEFNMDERFNLGVHVNGIFSYYPNFYHSAGNGDGTGINVIITPNSYTDNSIKVVFKNYVYRYSQSFHGFYLGLSAQTGLVRESYYSTLGPHFPQIFKTNNYKYNRFAFHAGRQWTLYNQGVIDCNIGVGFNNMDFDDEMKFTAIDPFIIHKNSAFFTTELAFGIGKPTMDQSLPRKPRLRDSLELDHALLLDFNAILNSGIELNYYHSNHKKRLWRNYVRVRNLRSDGINITQADSFHSLMVGIQYRVYPTSTRFRNGVYYGYGYNYEHGVAYFHNRTQIDNEPVDVVKKVLYDPHNFDITIGFTTILGHKYILDGYVSNILTLSKGRGSSEFSRINEATGFRTELGFKMGIARFRRR